MKRILIVDDDHDITLAFKRGLEGPEFSVDVYNDPSLASIRIQAQYVSSSPT